MRIAVSGRCVFSRMRYPAIIYSLISVWLTQGVIHADPLMVRAVASNLTSGNGQSYSPDNGNHSNPEGAGARILKALSPDIVMIQEFNTSVPTRQWVNQTFGEEYSYMVETGAQIPNGIISRFPMIASGSWDDPVLDNRDFAWAQIRLPESRDLWVVSVHLHSKGATSRNSETKALCDWIAKRLPKDAMILIGGDFNTRSLDESCLKTLTAVVVMPKKPPMDQLGDASTNAPRNRTYDWVLANESLEKHSIPLKIAGLEFPCGLVFDSRVFAPLEKVPPVLKSDSAAPNMQHMAVVRDFLVP